METNKTLSIYQSLARVILPEGILEYFEVTDLYEEHTGIIEETGLERIIIHIHLDELDRREKEWHDLKPNGFTEARLINDFPIRDHKVVLHVRRRRWLRAAGGSIILNHCSLVAEGTSYSEGFAVALKKILGHLPDTGPFSGAVL